MTIIKTTEDLEKELEYRYLAGKKEGAREVIEALPDQDIIAGFDKYKSLLEERFLQ